MKKDEHDSKYLDLLGCIIEFERILIIKSSFHAEPVLGKFGRAELQLDDCKLTNESPPYLLELWKWGMFTWDLSG